MRRGFLAGSSARGRSRPTLSTATSCASTTSSTETATAAQLTVSTPDASSRADDDATIAVPKDYTAVWQDGSQNEGELGLILQSDYRFDHSPYFGYFPPRAASPSMVYIDDTAERVEAAFSWPVWKQSEQPSVMAPSTSNTRTILPTNSNIQTIPSANSAARQVDSCSNRFTIRPVEGRGLAMLASRSIKRGQLIIKERPFYVALQTKYIAPDMGLKSGGGFFRSAVSRLSSETRRSLLALDNCHSPEEMDEIPGKLNTNYIPVDVGPRPDDTRKYCGAFATISRANHSCAPNANYFFEFSDYTGRLYAARDIKAGEEITVMYTDTLAASPDRRDSLYHSHRFICTCPFCTIADEAKQERSDSNRIYLKTIIDNLSQDVPASSVVDLQELRRAIAIAEQEQVWIYATQIRYLGGTALFLQGSTEHLKREGVRWLKLAMDEYALMEGPQAYHVRELASILGMAP